MQIGKQVEIKQYPKVEPFKLPKKESPEKPIPVEMPVREKEKVTIDNPKRTRTKND